MYKLYDPLASCKQWGKEAHPIDYATDSDPSTYWLSSAGLPSVDLTFDFTRIYKVSSAMFIFCNPYIITLSQQCNQGVLSSSAVRLLSRVDNGSWCDSGMFL